MFRTCSVALALVFLMNACSTMEYLDNSSAAEREQFKATATMSKAQLYTEWQRSKNQNDQLRMQVDAAQQENQKIQAQHKTAISGAKEEYRSLGQQLEQLNAEKQLVVAENEALKAELARREAQPETAAAPQEVSPGPQAHIKIKVLSGDGNLDSADKMAARLKSAGYTVQMVDRAPRSDFEATFIYFAADCRQQAERMQIDLGGRAALKPLNWPSQFDLIVVTGGTLK